VSNNPEKPETPDAPDTPDTPRNEDEMTTDQTRELPLEQETERTESLDTAVHEQAWPPAVRDRPSGPHLPPILLGVICLAIAGLAMWQELGDITVDWGNVGPLGIVAVGGLLVVLGLVGLLGSRRRTTH
jgi:hypothetical protein